MAGKPSWSASAAIAVLGLASLAAGCGDSLTDVISPLNDFTQTTLVADAASADVLNVDADLVNPWGIAFGPTGTLWVGNNHSGTATLYDSTGTKLPTTVDLPASGSSSTAAPTGVAVNTTAEFVIPGRGAAQFLFAGEDGTVSAWNSSVTTAPLVINRSTEDAVYKGIAIASNSGANFLYLTNFSEGQVDVFDGSFGFVKSFTDPDVPAGYAPFGIANIGGQLFVTFAKQLGPDNEDDEPGAGNGFVDVFNADGTLSKRFASNGRLNSPWAIVRAPSGFGAFAGDILVGNFGDGLILAYDPTSGALVDVLRDADQDAIAIDGLWGLAFGPEATSTTLYYAAGPDDEAHGVVGTLMPRP